MHLLLRLPPAPRAPLVQPGPLCWVPSRIKHFFRAFSSCRGWLLTPRVFQEEQEFGPFLHRCVCRDTNTPAHVCACR